MLFVDPASFMALFKEGLRVRENYQIIKGVPEDAQLLGTARDPKTGGVILVLYSKTFEQIPEGKQFPVIKVAIKTGNQVFSPGSSDGESDRAE